MCHDACPIYHLGAYGKTALRLHPPQCITITMIVTKI